MYKLRENYLTPMLAICLVSSAIPPGRSLTLTIKRHKRPSAASPLSKQRPRTLVSMFPPHTTTTTLQHEMNVASLFHKQLNECCQLIS